MSHRLNCRLAYRLGLFLACTALPVLGSGALADGAAQSTWDELSALIFDDRALLDGADLIAIDSPYRTTDDTRTRIAAQIAAPTGALIAGVTLVLDENPMPVSAVFQFDAPQPRFRFDATMRINGPTPLHVVAETTDGRLFVADAFVKTSGTGACAAPPGTDPAAALATLGNMTLGLGPDLNPLGDSPLGQRMADLAQLGNRLDIDIRHPSHSGMQKDQITLLFIPMRYVGEVQVDLDGAGYVEVTGSISLSENPRLSLSVPKGTQTADVTMTDTDGTTTTAHATLPGY